MMNIDILSLPGVAAIRDNFIIQLEERLAGLDDSLGSADLYAPGADPDRPRALTAERDAAQSRLDEVFARWEELEDLRG